MKKTNFLVLFFLMFSISGFGQQLPTINSCDPPPEIRLTFDGEPTIFDDIGNCDWVVDRIEYQGEQGWLNVFQTQEGYPPTITFDCTQNFNTTARICIVYFTDQGLGEIAVIQDPVSSPAVPVIENYCDYSVLNKPANTDPDIEYYWQGTACGVSETESGATYTVTESGTYYIGAKHLPTGLWSECTAVNVTVVKTPTAYSLTAMTSPLEDKACLLPTDPPAQITLSDTEIDVSYQRKLDGVNFGTPINGSGVQTSWETDIPGIYTVTATTTTLGCTAEMLNSAAVGKQPVSDNLSGPACTNETSFQISMGSELGIDYQLKLDNVPEGYLIAGTGAQISWTQSAPGTYSVTGIDEILGCTAEMQNTVTVSEPGKYSLSGPACTGGTSFQISLAGSQLGHTYQLKLNNSPVGGIPGTGSPISWNQTAAGTYTVTATNNTLGCTAEMLNSVTVNPIPSVTTIPDTRCGPGTVTLSATPSGGTVDWYNASGSFLQKNNSYSPTLSTTTTFYVEAVLNNCTTAIRVPVIGTISSVPTITSTTPNSRCGSGPVTLEAIASAGTVHWYLSPTDGAGESIGNDYTPTLTTTTPYYVDAVLDNCTTATRTEVIATVNPSPTAYNLTPVSGLLTGPGEIGLENTQAGVTYTLYRDGGMVSSTTILNNGDPLNFGEQSQPGIYTITGTIALCTVTMPGDVALSTYELIIDATGAKAGSSCNYTGVTVSSTFPSSDIFSFYTEALPYTASLSIQNGTSIENIQFYIDENATISNVTVEKNALYVALNPRYFRLLQDENSQNRVLQLGPWKYQSQIQLGGLNGIVYDNQAVDFSLLSPTNVTGSLEIFDVDGNPVSGGVTGFSWNGTDGINPVANGTYKYKITINQGVGPAIVINGHLIKNW